MMMMLMLQITMMKAFGEMMMVEQKLSYHQQIYRALHQLHQK
jgi:hypothetical protein